MTARERLGAYARLTRLPAGLTVPGDLLAGAAAGGTPIGTRLLGPVASSLCLYWGGMALNDYVDREVDARERPDRPVPSGAISPTAALTTATALTAAGLGLTALAEGRRGLCTAVPLTVAIWTYDLLAKGHPTAGPLVMATTRALDVLRGAGPGRLTTALPTALLSAVHTAAVTTLSRHEAAPGTGTPADAGEGPGRARSPRVPRTPHGSRTRGDGLAGAGGTGAVVPAGGRIGAGDRAESPDGAPEPALAEQPAGPAAFTSPDPSPGPGPGDASRRPARDAVLGSLGATAAVTLGIGLTAKDAGRPDRIVAGGLALGFLAAAGAAPLAALRKPTPYRVRRAVAAGIQAMVPLQSALAAAAGRSGAGLVLLAAYPPARRLSRKVSPT
ncbi:UbiA family prenyltransferase [Streptomyces canus]|uniref:UbiA family prenyltransferase n=1 Tax=Streptomyces canus TaxID=58343 RepID=UPI00036337CA|nr:UbiA family prenyltransferase [Streptomyces canus]